MPTGIELSSGIVVGSPKSLDAKYGPYDSVALALADLSAAIRYQGLTVGINNGGSIVEYWFRDGVADANFVEKVVAANWNTLLNKPSTFPPATHTHLISEVDGLQTALAGKQPTGDYATLEGGKVPASQLPSYVDDVLEFAAPYFFPAIGEAGKLYVAKDTNEIYRFDADNSAYVQLSNNWNYLINKPASFPPSSHTHPSATTSTAGFMSTTDKTKLDGIAAGAEVNVNADWNATTGDAAILNKPSTFPPSSHTHQAADLFGVLKLATDSYIVAEAGDNLATKYAAAKALTPNGNPLSATNRAALVIMPATYSLAADLTVDAEFVDVIGLGAQKLHRGSIPAVVFANNRIIVSANNVRVQGISVGTQNFIIQSNLPLQRIEDCTGGNESFGGFGTASGTFINCVGGVFAFGGEGSAVGTFANCVGGANSFGYIADASGSFINCVSGGGGFGSMATASGLFIDCDGPFGDFGTGGTASGTFINCTGGIYSFGSDTGAATGTFVNCTGGEYSFGGGDGGGIPGNATGKFYNCRLTAGTFWPVTSGGLMRNCIDGNNNLVDQ